MGKKHEDPSENFCPRVPIMHGKDLLFGKIQISFNHQKLDMYSFYGFPDFRGLTARLIIAHVS